MKEDTPRFGITGRMVDGKIVRLDDMDCDECQDKCNVELVRINQAMRPTALCQHCRTDHRYLGHTVEAVKGHTPGSPVA